MTCRGKSDDESVDIREQILDLQRRLAELTQINEELRDSLEKYTSLIESTDDSIYMVDIKGRYLFMNKKHLSRMGLRLEELLGREYGDFHSPDETRAFLQQVDTVVRTGESCQFEHRSVRDGGFFLRTLSPVAGTGNTVKSATVISKNITSLKNLEAELYALSLSDELTKLYNRRGFLTIAEQQIKVARRTRRPSYVADLCGHEWNEKDKRHLRTRPGR